MYLERYKTVSKDTYDTINYNTIYSMSKDFVSGKTCWNIKIHSWFILITCFILQKQTKKTIELSDLQRYLKRF